MHKTYFSSFEMREKGEIFCGGKVKERMIKKFNTVEGFIVLNGRSYSTLIVRKSDGSKRMTQ